MIQAPIWWLFLALAPVVYWLLPLRIRGWFLGLTSVALLAWFAPRDMALMGALSLAVYGAFQLDAATAPPWLAWFLRARTQFFVVLIFFVLAKYVPGLAEIFALRGSFLNFAVPLGVSYFSFKLLHYVIERGRGNFPAHTLKDYVAWLFLAPIFTAGPIERFEHYLANREDTRFEWRFVVEGLLRIIQGLVKKFALGAIVAAGLRHVTGGTLLIMLEHLPQISPAKVWAALLLTWVYVYLDFSAYSDVAIGSSRLFGLRIMENFHYPFVATSLQRFWQRWHMTLANFCRTYIYMSVIGFTRNPYVAIIATFAGMGLWHSASPQWIGWGLWQGCGMAVVMVFVRMANKRKWKFFATPAGAVAGWSMTMAYVVLGGALTALYGQAGIGQSLRLMARAFGVNV